MLCVAIVRRRLGTRIQLRRSFGVNCAAFRDSITITLWHCLAIALKVTSPKNQHLGEWVLGKMQQNPQGSLSEPKDCERACRVLCDGKVSYQL